MTHVIATDIIDYRTKILKAFDDFCLVNGSDAQDKEWIEFLGYDEKDENEDRDFNLYLKEEIAMNENRWREVYKKFGDMFVN